MLESLGYTEAPEREEADLILFNTCSIREAADERFLSHLGVAHRVKRERPGVIVGVGGCWAQSVKDEVFERFPFVDVAFGPGQVHKLAEFLTSDSITAQGFFEFEGFTGHLPMRRAREFSGLDADQRRLQLRLLVLHRPQHARAGGQPAARGARRRGGAPGRRRRARGDAPRAERQQLRPRPARGRRGGRATLLLRAPDRDRRDRGHRPHPLHEPAPQGHARGRHPRPRDAGRRLRAHPPAAAVGIDADPQGDAPHLHARALPGPRRADPRPRAGLRDHDGHHRRLPGGERGRLRPRRSRSSRRSASTARSRSSTRRAAARRPRRSPRASSRTR